METTQLIIGGVISFCLGGILYFVIRKRFGKGRKKSKQAASRAEKKAEQLVEEEHELKRKIKEKEAALKGVRVIFNRQGAGSRSLAAKMKVLHALNDDEIKLLTRMATLSDAELRYLKHIDIDVTVKKGSLHPGSAHVSDFTALLRKKIGKDIFDPNVARSVLHKIDTDPANDAILRCVKKLAFYSLRVYHNFEVMKGHLEEQGAMIKKLESLKDPNSFSKVFEELHSSVSHEASWADIAVHNAERLEYYAAQLKQNEAAHAIKAGPFLVVEGHPVDVIVDENSRSMETIGKSDAIDIGYLPSGFLISHDKHNKDTHIIINGDEEGIVVNHAKKGVHFQAASGSEDKIKVKRKKAELFTAKLVQLRDDDRIVFGSGYVFRFRKH